MIHPLRDWAARATELLDDPAADDGDVVASLRDIVRINRTFGGARAAARRLSECWKDLPRGTTLILLDVGTGLGDIPREAARLATRRGVRLRLIGVERHRAAARGAAAPGDMATVVADGGRLPFRDGSVDLVLCVKLLHHLPGESGTRLIREMDRVARRGAVVADIRRSGFAALGIYLASFPMRFHPATRHDGVVSVLRGFSRAELESRCATAGVGAAVVAHAGWSLTAAWSPGEEGS